MKEGERKIDEAIDKAGVPANGWRLSSLLATPPSSTAIG